MKQVFQSFADGAVWIDNVPSPIRGSGEILIKNEVSLISPGTERMLLEFGKANLISKARQQPEKVKEVLSKIQTDGLISTFDAVQNKLHQPFLPGYSAVGRVIEADALSPGFNVGQVVVSNGPHAGVVAVPSNLCAPVPSGVSADNAVFTVLGAVALQGIRLANPTLGETFVVFGLGLVGMLTVQLLVANGCKVIGIDLHPEKCSLAQKYGAQTISFGDPAEQVSRVLELTGGIGVDGVLLTLASSSSEPVSSAARFCRKKGRIVLVGVAGLELNRSEFYEKELSFQVSCSYGPGRYDESYEVNGIDYPISYVRWTLNRNFKAFLNLLQDNKVDCSDLVSKTYNIDNAPKAFKSLLVEKNTLGVLIRYNEIDANSGDNQVATTWEFDKDIQSHNGELGLAFIGAGGHASKILAPSFAKQRVKFISVMSKNGANATSLRKRFRFLNVGNSFEGILNDENIKAIVVSTRHNSHASYVEEALAAGKHVYCEKPLCLSLAELEAIEKVYNQVEAHLFVGFNRRFAPTVKKMVSLSAALTGQKFLAINVNAGLMPENHWTIDPAVGGGRIVGECCHFIDLARYVIGQKIKSWGIGGKTSQIHRSNDESMTINLAFECGSLAVINYIVSGAKKFPKERIELFADGKTLQIDNFRSLKGFGFSDFKSFKHWKQNKGHLACVRSFVSHIHGLECQVLSVDEIFEASRIAIELQNDMA